MKIHALTTLAGQRAALRHPPEQRAAAYAEQVMEPLRPLWEPVVARMGQTTFATEGPFAYLGLYPPSADAEEGLRRLNLLDEAGSQAACVRALELAWERLAVSGFDVIRGYIFGDWAAEQLGYAPQGLPDFAGYTVGYQIVRAYCARTGLTVAEANLPPVA